MNSHSISTIYSDGKYLGWPTVAQSRSTGRIFVVFSGRRTDHICPFGEVMMIISDDEGKTWSDARVIYDGPLDNRDAGVLVTSRGTVLVNWFTSVAYLRIVEKDSAAVQKEYTPEELHRWQVAAAKVTDECLKQELGHWIIRSEDNGETFSEKVPSIAASPHGPIELSDGRLFYIGKLRNDIKSHRDTPDGAPNSCRIGASESIDDGKTWRLLCDNLPIAEKHVVTEYYEYHSVEADNGTIIAQLRSHNSTEHGSGETLQMESLDGGRSWSVPHTIGVFGYPSHLQKLADGSLMMSYSHRDEPMGNYARISTDCGKTWGVPFVFGPTRNVDMGYPSSIELHDKNILSVWYEQVPNLHKAILRMALWSV